MTTRQKLIFTAFAVSVVALAAGWVTFERWAPFVLQLVGMS